MRTLTQTSRIVFIVTATIFALSGCGGNSGNPCNPSTYSDPQLESLEANAGIALADPDANDFYNYTRPVEASEIIDSDNFMISFRALVSYTVTKNAKPLRFSLFPNAYACSPYLPPLERNIEALEITSDAEFSNAYPSGISLNNVFELEFFSDSSPNQEVSRLLFNGTTLSINELVDLRPTVGSDDFLQFRPSQNPETEKTHVFTVYIRLTDGEEFLYTLDPVTFN